MELDRNKLITEVVRDAGYRVAFIKHAFGGGKTIEVAVENNDYSPLTIREIEKLHKFLVTKLYVENLIDDNTGIELGSPGLDRPLISPEDFKRFIGSKIKLSLKKEFEGRKKLQGVITQADEESVHIELSQEKEVIVFIARFEEINQANLIPQINFSKVK